MAAEPAPGPDPRFSERVEGPTPRGGVVSVAYWRDAGGTPTTKDRAVAVEVVELDKDGKVVFRTYARV